MAVIKYACNSCGRVINHRGRCDSCPPSRHDLSREQRGYGYEHRRRRSALLSSSIGLPCPICGEEMRSDQRLDLDHSVPLAVDAESVGDRMTHSWCNRSEGGKR